MEVNILYSDSIPRTMKKFRILIVDDNNFFRQTLRTTLQVSFPAIAIDEAVDGDEALQKVDTLLPDLVFMDIRLPGVDGLKLTKKIKTTHPNIVLLILTTYDVPEYRNAAFQYGADRFLCKSDLNPLGLEELVKSYQKA